MNRELISRLRIILEEFLNQQGYILVDANFVYEGGRLILRILTDRPRGGINLDECGCLNQQIGQIIDEKNLIGQSYILEVSSPGLDRPLKTEADFIRCIKREVVLYTYQPIKGKTENQGFIEGVNEGNLLFRIEEEIFSIPLSMVVKAKQVV